MKAHFSKCFKKKKIRIKIKKEKNRREVVYGPEGNVKTG